MSLDSTFYVINVCKYLVTEKKVAYMDKNELLLDRIRENKDPQAVLVST